MRSSELHASRFGFGMKTLRLKFVGPIEARLTHGPALAIPMHMADHSRFKELLDSKHQWPGDYTFKFVCAKDQLQNLKALFIGKKLELKESAQGKYISVTVTLRLNSSDAVIEIYEKAAQAVPGLISL